MNKREIKERIAEIEQETTRWKRMIDRSDDIKTKNKRTIKINKLIGEKFILQTYLKPEKENAIKN